MLKRNFRSFWVYTILSFLMLSIAGSTFAQTNTNTGIPKTQFTEIGSPKAGDPNDVNNVSFSEGVQTDVSIGLLQKILGNWHDSTPDPVMGALFKSLNLGILVFGSVFVVWISVAATLHSAEDGEVLGKKWGSTFVPLRMSIGFAAIFPLANGYSLIQLVVLWLATNGVGFANWTTTNTMGSFVKSQGMVITNQLIDDQALALTMTEILKAEACAAEFNYKYNEPGAKIKYVGLAGANVITGGSNNSYGKAVWGINPTYASDPRLSNIPSDVCGYIEISNFNSFLGLDNSSGILSDMGSNLTSAFSSGWKGSQLNYLNTAVRSAHFEAIVRAAQTLRPYAENFVYASNTTGAGGNSTGITAQVIKAAQDYRAFIAQKIQQSGSLPATEDMTTTMLSGINQSGWSTLGAWYYQFARINSVLAKLTSYAPSFQPSKSPMDPAVADMMAAVDAAIAQNASNPATVSQIKDMAGNYTAGTAYGGLYGGGISISNRASNNSAQFLATTFGVDPENKVNALIQLKDVGDYIIGTAEAIYVTKKAVEAAIKFKEATPVGAAVSAVSDVVGSVLSSPKVQFLRKLFGGVGDDVSDVMKYIFLFAAIGMLGFAMTLAFWIPMAPFILWLGAVLGWVIAVLEMVAAAPLWAAAHLHPEGEGMASKYGANGWMIILEVFAKPVLMVVGFFMASKVLDPFLRYSSQLFFNNMTTVNGDSLTGIVTTVAFVFMYVGFCLIMVHRCFSLIHIIPNSILRWVGSHGDRFSQSEQITGEMESKIHAYFVAAQSPIRNTKAAGGGKEKGSKNTDNARYGEQ